MLGKGKLLNYKDDGDKEQSGVTTGYVKFYSKVTLIIYFCFNNIVDRKKKFYLYILYK